MLLKNKLAIVTGGTGHLGRVIVRRFAAEGARVICAARGKAPAGLFPRGGARRITCVQTDVTSPEAVADLFRNVAGRTRVDILVNAAGGFAATGPVAETDPREWDRMLALNLKSAFLCCREFLRQKGRAKYGRIVNIAAQTVFRPSRNRAAYAVAKGGVADLTVLLGEELRGSGITVNALAPSIIDTPDNRRSMPGADFSTWVKPGFLAGEILHLCGPDASAVNGAVIPVFGGV